jgi:hypothetical protein
MIRIAKNALLVVAIYVLGGCAAFTYPEKEITSFAEVPEGYVLLVGKIELDPPLRPTEIKLDIPNDVFNTEEMMANRAIIGLSDRANVTVEKSGFLINPELGQTYFFAVPRERAHMLGGYITVSFDMRTNGPRDVIVSQGKVLVPGGMHYDLRPGDDVVYVGTLRLERGPFNDVTKGEVVDEFDSAKRDLATRFGADRHMRNSLPIQLSAN